MLDCCDREVTGFVAAPAPLCGEHVRDMMVHDRRQLFLHSNDNYSCRQGAGLMERHGDQRAFRIGSGKAFA